MKDLINRLRGVANNARLIGAYIGGGQRYLEEEAADALEAQQAEIEALKSIAYSDDGAGGEGMKLYLEHRTMKAEIEALRSLIEECRSSVKFDQMRYERMALDYKKLGLEGAQICAVAESEAQRLDKLLTAIGDAVRRK